MERRYFKDKRSEELIKECINTVVTGLIDLMNFEGSSDKTRPLILGKIQDYEPYIMELIEHDPPASMLAMRVTETLAQLFGQYSAEMVLKFVVDSAEEQAKDIPDDIADVFSAN